MKKALSFLLSLLLIFNTVSPLRLSADDVEGQGQTEATDENTQDVFDQEEDEITDEDQTEDDSVFYDDEEDDDDKNDGEDSDEVTDNKDDFDQDVKDDEENGDPVENQDETPAADDQKSDETEDPEDPVKEEEKEDDKEEDVQDEDEEEVFIEYSADDVVSIDGDCSFGYSDYETDSSRFIASGFSNRKVRNSELPATYDLRTQHYTTSVKDQRIYGTCWAHSVLASMESSYLKKYDDQLDLSEYHLAYFAYHNLNKADRLNLVTGDGLENTDESSPLQGGGNSIVSTYMLASGMGPVNESSMPYPYMIEDSDIEANTCFDTSSYYMTEARWIDCSDSASIKKIIYNYGAVAMNYFAIGTGGSVTLTDGTVIKEQDFYNKNTYAWYNNQISGSNHGVTIVGWDDNFDKNNFVRKPQNNGAWIVKNSWGTSYGDEGYFYISYEDKAFKKNTSTFAQFDIEETHDNIYIYQYDATCPLEERNYTNSYTIGNIYTAQHNETISKVGYYTEEAGVTVTVNIYENPQNNDPDSGVSQLNDPITTVQAYAGYHTVDVGNISIAQGEKFSVVVHAEKNPDYDNLTLSLTKTSTKQWIKATDAISSGQSFLSLNSGESWTDLKDQNCTAIIKAYTSINTSVHYINYRNLYNATNTNPRSFTGSDGVITLTSPYRRGYKFEGWYTDRACTQKIETIDPSQYTGNIDLYAKWSLIEYTITYETFGGTTDNQTKFTMESHFELKPAVKEHYDFLYWYGLTESGEEAHLTTFGPNWNGDITLYAKWKPKEYKITYNLNGGTTSSVRTYTIESDTFTLKTAYKKNYGFRGWTGEGIIEPTLSVTIEKGSYGDRVYTANFGNPYLNLTGSGVSLGSRIYINGQPRTVDSLTDMTVNPSDNVVVCYTMKDNNETDVHKQYATAMKVYFMSEDALGNRKLVHKDQFDNILSYAGASIRITGKKGIRIITSIPTAKKNSLISSNLNGYKVMEYGTLMCWASNLPAGKEPTVGMNKVAKGRSYSREAGINIAFSESGGVTKYTNVLVGDYSDAQCASDVAMRSYMIIRPVGVSNSSQDIVLYGGTIYRSISYVALQNKNSFKPGTSGYEYIWNLIRAAYPDVYNSEYRGNRR